MKGVRLLQLAVTCLLWLLAAGCGDDEAMEPEPEPPEGEACQAEGMTETGCRCSTERPPGSRVCLATKVWSDCECPPARDCNPGQSVRCRLCDGETERRIVTCASDATYDCSCDGGGADSGL